MRASDGPNPVLMGIALIGVGLLARRLPAPRLLDLPGPGEADTPHLWEVRDVGDAAHIARDRVASVIPANLFATIGRSLIAVGAAVLAVRLLDELVDDQGAEY